MAAIGGDTVVPTNWTGLIGVVVLVAVIATATYFGLTLQGGTGEVEVEKDDLTVQEVFSANARRDVAAAEPVRALPRTEFVADSRDTGSEIDADTEQGGGWDIPEEQWNAPAESVMDDGEDEPAVARATPAPRQSQARSTPAPARQQAEAVDARKRPRAEALVAWWKDGGDGLGVRFAGPLDRGRKVSDGVAVMFTEAVSAQQANDHLTLTDESGQSVEGRWETGANPTLVLLSGLKPGRYELTITSGLRGSSGKTLENTVAGPVFVY